MVVLHISFYRVFKNFFGSLALFFTVSLLTYFVLIEPRTLWAEIGIGLVFGIGSLPLMASFLEVSWWWREVPAYIFDQKGVRKRYSRKKMILWKYENILKVSAFKKKRWFQSREYSPIGKMIVFFRFPSKETGKNDEKLFIFESEVREKFEDIIPELLKIPGLQKKTFNNLIIEEADQKRLFNLFHS